MYFSPKAAHENHNIHPRDERTNDRKTFRKSRSEGNKIIPGPECCDEIAHPLDSKFDPVWLENRDKQQHQRYYHKKYHDELRNVNKNFFHSSLYSMDFLWFDKLKSDFRKSLYSAIIREKLYLPIVIFFQEFFCNFSLIESKFYQNYSV